MAAEPPSGKRERRPRWIRRPSTAASAPRSLGSNGLGIGRDGANGERALLLSNTHFPWQGSERWYEIHMTIPGKLNVIGAALQGVPVVNLGFTRGLAWSHTVSTARRFTPYELDLRRGRPTEYVVDGRAVKMRKRTVRVRVRGGARRHTFYETRWGPVFSFAAAGPDVGHRARVRARRRQRRQLPARQPVGAVRPRAVGRRPAPRQPPRAGQPVDQHDRRRLGRQRLLLRRVGGPERRRRPAVALLLGPPDRARSCSRRASILLDGSRARCRWKNDRDAVAKGIIGPKGLPRATRTDYVENSNDSYWLPSARFRLDGFPRIIGGEGTQRLLRTRLAMTLAEQRLAGTDGLGPPGFTLPTLQQVMFGNRNLSAELARDTTVSACQASGRADLAEACTVLAAWDTRADIGSRGAVLWREYWTRLSGAGVPWTVAYDPADPVGTPRAIDGADPKVLTALTGAVEDLRAKGIALDVPLGDLQAEPRGSERIPIHGCSEGEGCFNIVSTERDDQGRYDPFTGASFIMTAAFDTGGTVRGEAVLSYSQSENPESPHYADQTRLYSQKQWLPMRFTEQQIRSDPEYERTVVTGRR